MEARPADIISDVLRAVRLTGAAFFRIEACAPWVAEAPAAAAVAQQVMPAAQRVMEYHLVTRGRCWVSLLDGSSEPVALLAGGIVVFPQGDAHVVSSAPGMRAAPLLGLYRQPRTGESLPFDLRMGAGGGERSRLVCGFLGCDTQPFNPLIQALPRMLCLPASALRGRWLGALAAAAVEESRQRRPGGDCLLARMSELLFLEVIRAYLAAQTPALAAHTPKVGAPPLGARGWLAALADPPVGQALRLLHRRPAHGWCLHELARQAGASRTVLTERFATLLGIGPMTYLFRWRMQLAAGLLRNGMAVAVVAAEVGYGSEAAFSRAFKRCTGLAPNAWRQSGGAIAKHTVG